MDYQAILMTIIAFSAVLTVLITTLTFIFNALLRPVKENQARLEKDLNEFKTEVNNRFTEVNDRFTEVNNRFTEVNDKFDKLNEKIDRLLSR